MVTEERTIALAMAEHLVNELKDIPVARTLWVDVDRDTTILMLVTFPFPLDPDIRGPLYDAAITLDDAFPGHYYRFHVLNPAEYADGHFSTLIHRTAVPFEIHSA
jgi:hypothetical protein